MKPIAAIVCACVIGSLVGILNARPNRAVVEAGGAPPRFDAGDTRAASEAIRALKKMQSVLDAGINFRDYSTRVLDAKVDVDAALSEIRSEELRSGLQDAMRAYVAARDFWEHSIQHGDKYGFVSMSDYELSKYRVYGVTRSTFDKDKVWKDDIQQIWRYASEKMRQVRDKIEP